MTEALVREYASRLSAFEQNINAMLQRYESSNRARVIALSVLVTEVEQLNADQEELLKQSLRCAEHGLYRAAHVMAWAAYVDGLQAKLASDGFAALRAARPKWHFTDMADLAEQVTEHALLTVAKDLGLLGKADFKALSGDLSRRNECAHPTGYLPGVNETLGYIQGLLKRMGRLANKSLQTSPTLSS